MLTLVTWLRQCVPGFPAVHSLFFPFRTVLLGGQSRCVACIRGVGSCNIPPRGRGKNIYKKYLEFVSSPSFIYLHSFIYECGLTNTYFIIWVIIQHYFSIFCCSTHSSFGHWEIFQLAPWSLSYLRIMGLFTYFENILTFWHYKILQAHLLYYLSLS